MLTAPPVPPVEVHPLAKCCWCGASFMRGPSVLEVVHPDRPHPWVCPVHWSRQLADAMVVDVKGRGGRQTRFVPLPRQVEAIDALLGRGMADGGPTYVLIGGAAGGSKSKGLREIAHTAGMSTPGFRTLLLRRTYKELDQTHIRDGEIEAPEMGAVCVPSAKLIRYPNGSTLQFGHCETSADAANYLSAEYDLIIFDELVTFEELQFLLISSRARSTKPGVRPKVLAGTNPGGPQAHWVRSRFIDKTVDVDQYPDYRPEDYCYIPSKLDDNPYLDQHYERKLLALPPELRRAYREGDWDIFPGQYFPEFRKALHISHVLNPATGQMEPTHIAYPASLPRSLSLDWGFVKPGSCGFWVDVDGHKYREQEYIFTRTTAFAVGQEIGRRIVAAGYKKIRHLVYDTAMNIPNNDTGESTIDSVLRGIRSMGVSLSAIPADKERINGWQRLRHWLGMAPDGRPWLQSSPLCPYFNRTIPSLVSDRTNPEDVNSDGEDHAADEARYEVMASPIPASGMGPVTKPLVPGMMGWLRNQVRKEASSTRRMGQVA